MKLHDPATERHLLDLAGKARAGRPPESGEARPWKATLETVWNRLFILGFFAGISVGLHAVALHWQYLIASVLLMWGAHVGLGTLVGSINSYHAVLFNLPIRGEHALRWFRSRFLMKQWPSMLVACFMCSLVLSTDFLEKPLSLVVSSVLLAATTFATMILSDEPWLRKSRITKVWSVIYLLSICCIGFLFFTRRKMLLDGGTPEWMADSVLCITWIFPPSWAMPGRFELGGFWLAVPWMAWGLIRWLAWPQTNRRYFDAPLEEVGLDFSEEDEEDEDFPAMEPPFLPIEENEPLVAEIGKAKTLRLPDPLFMSQRGWVERWVHRMIATRDQALAGALFDPAVNWTRHTNRLIVLAPVWLLAVWAFARYFPESNRKETIGVFIWIISPIIVGGILLPITNAIPRATAIGFLGAQSLPFFSAVPVSVRDLLRISNRITWARSVIAAAIATPFFWIQLAIFDPNDNLWILWLVPAVCIFWANSRPVFIWFRLQSMARRRRGAWLVHVVGTSLCLVLVMAWLLSAVAGVASGVGMFGRNLTETDRWLLPSVALGSLLVSALCARAVFELYRWMLTRRWYDWLNSR